MEQVICDCKLEEFASVRCSASLDLRRACAATATGLVLCVNPLIEWLVEAQGFSFFVIDHLVENPLETGNLRTTSSLCPSLSWQQKAPCVFEVLEEFLVHSMEPFGACTLETGNLRKLCSLQFSVWHQKAF